MDRSEIARIASELEQVLAEQPYQVSFLREFHAALARNDIAAATQMYSSLEMWGGSGSVADIYLPSREANQRLKSLLIELNQHFETAGVVFPRATRWTAAFREWQEMGI